MILQYKLKPINIYNYDFLRNIFMNYKLVANITIKVYAIRLTGASCDDLLICCHFYSTNLRSPRHVG